MSDFDAQDLTAAGSGKSEAEIAFELVSKLKGQGVWGERNMADILDMYAECLDAAKGLRAYKGQKRVEVIIHKDTGEPIPQKAPAQPPVNTQPAVAKPQATQPIAAQPAAVPQTQTAPRPPQQPQVQPVHAQQQAVAQAYKPAG